MLYSTSQIRLHGVWKKEDKKTKKREVRLQDRWNFEMRLLVIRLLSLKSVPIIMLSISNDYGDEMVMGK